ncbi:hypothetical protein OF83DRAFT_1172569 [Amylostereum chailletii]|nr:hypothetical protein OF83DRAFT_1172569 [Amylostereum chailletii]
MSPTGPGRKPTTLSREQTTHVKMFLPAFEEQVQRLDPTFQGHCTELTTWKKSTANEILRSELFAEDIADVESGRKVKAWMDAVMRIFINHQNNNMKRAAGSGASEHGISSSDFRSFVNLFLPNETGRQLFEDEHKDELITKSSCVGEYQKLLKTMWNGLDEDGQGRSTTPRPGKLSATSTEITHCFKNDNGSLNSSIIQIHSTPDIVDFGRSRNEDAPFKAFTNLWQGFSHRALPRCTLAADDKSIDIPRNTDGIPVFPEVDLELTLVGKIRTVLTAYFDALWAHSCSAGASEELPWPSIKVNPSGFYDTVVFSPPSSCLDVPNTLSSAKTLMLVEYLAQTSSMTALTPFQLRARSVVETGVETVEEIELTTTVTSSDDQAPLSLSEAEPGLEGHRPGQQGEDCGPEVRALDVVGLPAMSPSIMPPPVDAVSNAEVVRPQGHTEAVMVGDDSASGGIGEPSDVSAYSSAPVSGNKAKRVDEVKEGQSIREATVKNKPSKRKPALKWNWGVEVEGVSLSAKEYAKLYPTEFAEKYLDYACALESWPVLRSSRSSIISEKMFGMDTFRTKFQFYKVPTSFDDHRQEF